MMDSTLKAIAIGAATFFAFDFTRNLYGSNVALTLAVMLALACIFERAHRRLKVELATTGRRLPINQSINQR